jgi:hypothetical protein
LGLACQGVPDKEQGAIEFLEYMTQRVATLPKRTIVSSDPLQEWSGPKAVQSIDPAAIFAPRDAVPHG